MRHHPASGTLWVRPALVPIIILLTPLVHGRPGRTQSIRGVVTTQAPPQTDTQPVTVDTHHCGQAVSRAIPRVKQGKLGGAVVWLSGLADPSRHKNKSAESSRIVIDQNRCVYEPHVQTATVGTTLVVKTQDPVMHSVHARTDAHKSLWNLAMPPRGRPITRRLDTPGLLRLGCDVHRWMAAFIYVFDHPYHAVTNEDGAFEFKNVPAGTWDLNVWHETLGTRVLPVKVSAAPADVRVTVDMPAPAKQSR